MLKTILYLGLLSVGLTWALFNPLVAAVVHLQTYFVNPNTVAREAPYARYQFWTAIVFILSVLVHNARGLQPVGREGRLLKALWVYCAIIFASALWAVASRELAYEYARDFSKTILIAAMLPLVVRSHRDMNVLILACLVGVAHTAFLSTWGKHKLDWVSRGAFVLTDRAGSVLLLFLPLFLLLGMYGRRYERIFCWLSLPFILDWVIRSNHRAYFVGIVVQLALLIVLLPKRIVVRLAPIIGVGAFLFLYVLTPDKYWAWIETIAEPKQESSAASRYDINAASLAMLKDYPLGVGYHNYAEVSGRYLPPHLAWGERGKNTHNTFFSVACETGLPGFAVWLFAVGGAVLLFRRIRKQADYANPTRVELYAMGMEFGIYGALVGDCFHTGYETDPLYWFVGFAVILTRLYHQAEPAAPSLAWTQRGPAPSGNFPGTLTPVPGPACAVGSKR